MNTEVTIKLELFILALLFFVPVRSALADLHECDGQWTNKPCSGTVTGALDEANFSKAISEDPNRSQKASLVHELTMKSLKARDDYGIKMDLSAVEETCLKKPATVEECRAVIKSTEDELDKKISQASTLDSQKKTLALQEKANKLQEERNKIEQEKANVVVVEKRPIILRPRDEVNVPGHGQSGNHGLGYGVSVQLGGNSGDTKITVGANVEGGKNTSSGISVPHSSNSLAPVRSGIIIREHAGQRTTEAVGVSGERNGTAGKNEKRENER